MALKYADGADSFQRLAVPSVWIEFHVALRGRVELTQSIRRLIFFAVDIKT